MKKPSADQKGLKKLPKEVRNKMGYYAKGGMAGCSKCGGDKSKCSCGKYSMGGMAKKRGYAKGGYVSCGASNPPSKKRT